MQKEREEKKGSVNAETILPTLGEKSEPDVSEEQGGRHGSLPARVEEGNRKDDQTPTSGCSLEVQSISSHTGIQEEDTNAFANRAAEPAIQLLNMSEVARPLYFDGEGPWPD